MTADGARALPDHDRAGLYEFAFSNESILCYRTWDPMGSWKMCDGPAEALYQELCRQRASTPDPATVRVLKAALDLCPSEGIWKDEPRMDYDEVQIDKDALKEFREAVEALAGREK